MYIFKRKKLIDIYIYIYYMYFHFSIVLQSSNFSIAEILLLAAKCFYGIFISSICDALLTPLFDVSPR